MADPAPKAEALAAQLATVIRERDALRDRVAELEAALITIDALDPEHQIVSCAQAALCGLVLRMGEIARDALSQNPKEKRDAD